MPRLRGQSKKRDELKAMFLERQSAMKLSNEDAAARIGVSRATYSRMKAKATEKWTLAEIISACKAFQITASELREAIKFM